MTEIVRAERVDFQVAPGYFLEFYRLPTGEKRIGVTSASVICGHAKNYLSQVPETSPKRWKSLRDLGFTGSWIQCRVGRAQEHIRGSSISQTMSQDDFRKFVEFSAFDLGKKPAQAIARALLGVAIETVARQAFGEEALTLDEIRQMICKEFAKTLDWMEEDRQDTGLINEHLLFLEAV